MYTKENVCWHFTGATLRDGTPIPAVGIPLIYDKHISICKSGLHWSRQPFQALQYAPGGMLHMVEVEGVVTEHKDKGVSRKRTIIKSINATYLLRRFAADQALSVKHLWDMPKIVEEYLISLDENKKDARALTLANAVWDATMDAAWVAARDAAWTAARDAAWDAARDAVGNAAWAAVWVAARDAAWAAARDDFNSRVYKEFGLEE